MRRINTGAIIAPMANGKTRGNIAVSNFPAYSVSCADFAGSVNCSPIPGLSFTAQPFPAAISPALIDLCPKPFGKRLRVANTGMGQQMLRVYAIVISTLTSHGLFWSNLTSPNHPRRTGDRCRSASFNLKTLTRGPMPTAIRELFNVAKKASFGWATGEAIEMAGSRTALRFSTRKVKKRAAAVFTCFRDAALTHIGIIAQSLFKLVIPAAQFVKVMQQ